MSTRRDEDERITALALAAGRGDRRALAEWVRATQADVWRLLAHLTDTDRADDLTQETYLRAFRTLPRFAARSSSRAWLLSIARRVLVDHIRAAGSRPRTTHLGWEPVPEERVARRTSGFEDIVELRLLLADLTPERQEVIVLTQILGLSYQEAAEVCGCPVGTIRSRIARAREDLLDATTARDDAL
ncbi:sigma-70 family RNA polymerase sigma factor [Amycolatopsis endophytica]|uniref:RNA polymerase sigma factor n=1 Tax=Amycolatopsis endophytica TaxID=860233 RepID=A0A853B9E2_9PSEU|nr:RNA polymerase sigma factor SigC [Amycolatopsis endophytica]NYI91357.1 RNA polymerase sigma-70 factor (ECF subfamily) [Amycolatopsis endophytica]